jgi:hypothetical protein
MKQGLLPVITLAVANLLTVPVGAKQKDIGAEIKKEIENSNPAADLYDDGHGHFILFLPTAGRTRRVFISKGNSNFYEVGYSTVTPSNGGQTVDLSCPQTSNSGTKIEFKNNVAAVSCLPDRKFEKVSAERRTQVMQPHHFIPSLADRHPALFAFYCDDPETLKKVATPKTCPGQWHYVFADLPSGQYFGAHEVDAQGYIVGARLFEGTLKDPYDSSAKGGSDPKPLNAKLKYYEPNILALDAVTDFKQKVNKAHDVIAISSGLSNAMVRIGGIETSYMRATRVTQELAKSINPKLPPCIEINPESDPCQAFKGNPPGTSAQPVR